MIVSKYRNNIFRDLIGCLYSKLTHNVWQLTADGPIAEHSS